MISYKDQLKNHTLHKFIRATSVISYQEHWSNGTAGDQCEQLKKVYEDNPLGLTDREALTILRLRGLDIDAGTVPARRHDLNKVWVKLRDYSGVDLPATFIVNIDKRTNTTGRKAEVWCINPQITK